MAYLLELINDAEFCAEMYRVSKRFEKVATGYEVCTQRILSGNLALMERMPKLLKMRIELEAELIDMVIHGWSNLE